MHLYISFFFFRLYKYVYIREIGVDVELTTRGMNKVTRVANGVAVEIRLIAFRPEQHDYPVRNHSVCMHATYRAIKTATIIYRRPRDRGNAKRKAVSRRYYRRVSAVYTEMTRRDKSVVSRSIVAHAGLESLNTGLRETSTTALHR